MNEGAIKLFVYSSLRSGFRNPAYQYLTRYFTLLGESVVQAQFFDQGEYPVAVPSDDDHFIHGELYQLNDNEDYAWAFEQLDDYEGVKVEPGEHAYYHRSLSVVYHEGKPCEAWIYWFNGEVEGMPAIATGDVFTYLQEKNKP